MAHSVTELRRRTKLSKIVSSFSSGIPTPVSRTLNRRRTLPFFRPYPPPDSTVYPDASLFGVLDRIGYQVPENLCDLLLVDLIFSGIRYRS